LLENFEGVLQYYLSPDNNVIIMYKIRENDANIRKDFEFIVFVLCLSLFFVV